MLRIENISKRYPNGTLALEEADLHVGEGDFITILGLSGAGKSTLLRSVAVAGQSRSKPGDFSQRRKEM